MRIQRRGEARSRWQACLFFWEQSSDKTGQVLDRARNDLNGSRDPRRIASIAATGFGLTALCIADRRKYLPHAQIVDRVRTTLDLHLNNFPEVHGFYYHFSDIEPGERVKDAELSSIDTSLLHNSVTATKAHKAFCLSYPKWYNEDYWGISASDYEGGYTAWGGPPPQGPLDGTVVPCASAGSLAFLPADCISVLPPCGTNGESRHGVDAALLMRSTPRRTGMTQMCLASTRAYRCSWQRI